jgi:hypothetical protein
MGRSLFDCKVNCVTREMTFADTKDGVVRARDTAFL